MIRWRATAHRCRQQAVGVDELGAAVHPDEMWAAAVERSERWKELHS